MTRERLYGPFYKQAQNIWFTFLFSLINVAVFCQPTITSFSPLSGPIGTTVTITGTNFSSTPSNNLVFFGAVRAAVLTSGTNTLSVRVPAGASYQPITVTTNNLTAWSNIPFDVTFNGGGTPLASSSFAPKIDFTTGRWPSGLLAIDIDGDGKPDLATVNQNDNSLSLFRNTGSVGNISLAPKQDFITGASPITVNGGDLDGDGKLDMIVANNLDSSISIYINKSTPGNFSLLPKTDLHTNEFPNWAGIRDVDGDGKPDIVVVHLNGNSWVFRNTSTAGVMSFAAPEMFAFGSHTLYIGFADLDGDGKTDVAAATENQNRTYVSRNQSTVGNIQFDIPVGYPSGTTTTKACIADLDGDGKQDLITANKAGNGGITFLKNMSTPGNLSFPNLIFLNYSSNTYDIDMGDVDGDGKPDIVAASYSINNGTQVYRNSTAGGIISFDPQINYAVGQNPGFVILADLDGDGKLDLTTTNNSTNNISVLRNTIESIAIDSASPMQAGPGIKVTIFGRSFNGVTSVSFGGIPADSFNIISSDTITAVVGSGNSGDIKLSTATGSASIPGFVFVSTPAIKSFVPDTAGPGTTIVIRGTSLSGTTAVSFGGIPAASFTVTSDTAINAVVGQGTSGNLTITTTGGTIFKTGFVFMPAPVINSFSPANAAVGNTVQIRGSHFTSVNAVRFGETDAAGFSVTGDSIINAIVGSVTGGNVFIGTAFGSDSVPGFYNGISISSVNPLSGLAGSTVSITGKNFSATPGNNIVYFGAIQASVLSTSNNSMTVSAPRSATYQPVTVTSQGITAYANNAFDIVFNNALPVFDSTSYRFKSGIRTGAFPFNFSACDLDGDGLPELAVPGSGYLSVFRNNSMNGTVAFAPAQTFRATGTVPNAGATACDIDGDGKQDLVVSIGYAEGIGIFKNTSSNGNLSFIQLPEFPGAGHFVEKILAADLDLDGKPDLILLNDDQNSVVVHKNRTHNGEIIFAPPISFPAGQAPHSVAVGDFNGDGKPDLAIGHENAPVQILLNTSSPGKISFSQSGQFPSHGRTSHIETADIDGDGKPDLIISNYFNSLNYPDSSVSILRNISINGNILFDSLKTFGTGVAPNTFGVADLDGDGKPDLVTNNITNDIGTGNFSLLKNNSEPGNISFAPKFDHNIGTRPSGIFIADWNGNGIPDIAVGNFYDSSVSIYLADTAFHPVFRLVFFTGQVMNGHASLQWQTANEEGMKKYIVQYSTDSLQFSDIDSQLVSGTNNYLFNDTRNLNANNYYRLKMIDTLGNYSFSNFINILKPPAQNNIIVKPNPAKGSVTLVLPVSSSQSVLEVYDMRGKRTKMITLPPNTSELNLSIGGLAIGTYNIVWNDGVSVYRERLMVVQ